MLTGKYDAVVAGAGVGGLCSAALLARHGYRVLLVERLERLGGRFSTIEQDGFKTPTGAVMIATRGILQQIFDEVGARFNIKEGGAGRVWLFGEWHDLPEKGQIQTLLDLLEKMGAGRARIVGRLARGALTEKVLGAFRRAPPTDRSNLMSFRDWLRQYTDDERVLQLFHALTSAISTVNDFEYPASHWFTYVSAAGQGGMRYHGISPNGNVENANALAETVRARGGQVLVNSPIEQIVISGGRVTGAVVNVEHKQKVEVETQFFISDLGPKRTVELAGRNNFSPDYLKQVDELRAAPIVANLIASDRPLVDSNGGLLIVGAKRIVAGVPMTLYSPALAPPGQHLMVIWGTPASCLNHIDRETEARENLDDIRRVFPDFDRYGRLLRQDIRDIDDEFPALRSWMGYDMPQESPVPNLFHVGDAVKPYGWEGVAACAKSASIIVDKVRRRFHPGGPGT